MRRRLPLLGLLVWLVVSGVQADPVSEGLTAWRAGDFNTAHRHWQGAAEAGDPQAMFLVSDLYSHGKGIPTDPEKALRWLRASADAGHPPACYNLGDRYLNGIGVPKDPALAAHWWRRAAVQGLVQAQYNLGTLYYQGLGVPRDHEQAAWWYQQAAELGSSRARQALAVLERSGVIPRKDSAQDVPASVPSTDTVTETRAAQPATPVASADTGAGASSPSPQNVAAKPPETGVDPFDLALGPEWLHRQPPEGYTVQVFASNDRLAVTRFLSDYRFSRQVAVYPFNKAGQTWYGVVYGRFSSRADARAALSGLPVMVQRGRPWVRQLKEIIALLDEPGG